MRTSNRERGGRETHAPSDGKGNNQRVKSGGLSTFGGNREERNLSFKGGDYSAGRHFMGKPAELE